LVEQLRPTGAAIGLIDQTSFGQKDVFLRSGDRLFMYTDGVVESANEYKELFGEDRLQNLLQASTHLSPSLLISSLRESLQRFTYSKSPGDDTTIIVMDIRE
jgi:serine phosphatase RsbU (regulator of sigma subunit)